MDDLKALQEKIDAMFDAGGAPEDPASVETVIGLLDRGEARVAEPVGDDWVVHDWLKKAILLYFRVRLAGKDIGVIRAGDLEFFDKLPVKHDFEAQGVRVVPPAVARYGAFLAPGTIMMPSYVNIGAYVGAGTLVDTWATVGSCAQVGENVHLSGGVGIGGVLEPVQANPVVIEDGAFIGSRCVVVEGVRVGREAVLGAGVVLTASTPIIDVTGSEATETRGFVPPRAVVIQGSRPKSFPAGDYGLPCGLIVGWRSEKTDSKLQLEATLRDLGVSLA